MTSPVIHALTANDSSDRPIPPPDHKWAEINRSSSLEYPHGFITYHFENPPEYQAEEVIATNWAQFRLGMLADVGFLRVVAYGMPIFQASLASEINQNPPNEPNVSAIALIWNQIIAGLPQGTEPTETEVASWNAIALSANVPLEFGLDGSIP